MIAAIAIYADAGALTRKATRRQLRSARSADAHRQHDVRQLMLMSAVMPPPRRARRYVVIRADVLIRRGSNIAAARAAAMSRRAARAPLFQAPQTQRRVLMRR